MSRKGIRKPINSPYKGDVYIYKDYLGSSKTIEESYLYIIDDVYCTRLHMGILKWWVSYKVYYSYSGDYLNSVFVDELDDFINTYKKVEKDNPLYSMVKLSNMNIV